MSISIDKTYNFMDKTYNFHCFCPIETFFELLSQIFACFHMSLSTLTVIFYRNIIISHIIRLVNSKKCRKRPLSKNFGQIFKNLKIFVFRILRPISCIFYPISLFL